MLTAPGDLVTVAPHRLPHGARCGTFHARVRALGDGTLVVQQIRAVDGHWKPGMSTSVYAGAVRPIEVQLDLFGNPA